jgi:membrane protease YdiL (CAAX protease family)
MSSRISRRLKNAGVLLSIILLNIIMVFACAIFAHALVGWFPNADISIIQVFGVSVFACLLLQAWAWRRYDPLGTQQIKKRISELGVRAEL